MASLQITELNGGFKKSNLIGNELIPIQDYNGVTSNKYIPGASTSFTSVNDILDDAKDFVMNGSSPIGSIEKFGTTNRQKITLLAEVTISSTYQDFFQEIHIVPDYAYNAKRNGGCKLNINIQQNSTTMINTPDYNISYTDLTNNSCPMLFRVVFTHTWIPSTSQWLFKIYIKVAKEGDYHSFKYFFTRKSIQTNNSHTFYNNQPFITASGLELEAIYYHPNVKPPKFYNSDFTLGFENLRNPIILEGNRTITVPRFTTVELPIGSEFRIEVRRDIPKLDFTIYRQSTVKLYWQVTGSTPSYEGNINVDSSNLFGSGKRLAYILLRKVDDDIWYGDVIETNVQFP
jgi:hypothetical protein